MLIDFEPGDYVTNPANKDWGVGQVQSIIGNKITVNFENCGKKVLNIENISLKMKILLSNDDGYFAKGLSILTEALELVADVTVMAPDQNRSGASNSLTLNQPLRISKLAHNRFKVNGTPADCVHLALTGYLKKYPI